RAGRRQSPGRGAPRGGGSSGRRGREGGRLVGRARHPTGRRSKQAATAGRGTGWSVGRGAPRGGGRGGEGWAGAAGPPRQRVPGAAVGDWDTATLRRTWVNTQGDGGVGCPARRDVAGAASRRASWPGSAPRGPHGHGRARG